jgi:hypothetical protein
MSCSACSTGMIGALVISRSIRAALNTREFTSEGLRDCWNVAELLLLNVLPLLYCLVHLQSET